jgi:hypothetical protein
MYHVVHTSQHFGAAMTMQDKLFFGLFGAGFWVAGTIF